MTLDYLQLLDSEPIYIDGIGHIVPPTIRSIMKIGLKAYYSKLNIMKTTIELIDTNVFDILCFDNNILRQLIDSFQFFMLEQIEYDRDRQIFVCCNTEDSKIVGAIDRENFNELSSLILQLNFIQTKSYEQLKPKNKEAERILKKLQSAPQNRSDTKNLSISEMIAAICSNIDAYKYSDIWSLTVYQLYDLFFRLKLRKQIDITAQRWAVWGADPFDFDLWCKNIIN